MKKLCAIVALTILFAAPAWSDTRTVTLSVPDMNCVTCPITVRTALKRVEGVIEARVNYDRREARVVFDESKTSIEALTQATANVGYPSFPKLEE